MHTQTHKLKVTYHSMEVHNQTMEKSLQLKGIPTAKNKFSGFIRLLIQESKDIPPSINIGLVSVNSLLTLRTLQLAKSCYQAIS